MRRKLNSLTVHTSYTLSLNHAKTNSRTVLQLPTSILFPCKPAAGRWADAVGDGGGGTASTGHWPSHPQSPTARYWHLQASSGRVKRCPGNQHTQAVLLGIYSAEPSAGVIGVTKICSKPTEQTFFTLFRTYRMKL